MDIEKENTDAALEHTMEVPAGNDTPTRHSSKLSLGSSPSVLSGDDDEDDDQIGIGGDDDPLSSTDHLLDDDDDDVDGLFGTTYNGQDALTPTDKILEEEEEEEEQDANNVDLGDSIDNHDKNNKSSKNNKKTNSNNNNSMDEQNDDDLFKGSLPLSTSDHDDITMDQDSASPLSSVPDDFPLSRSVSPELGDDDQDPILLLSTAAAVASPSTTTSAPVQTASHSPAQSQPTRSTTNITSLSSSLVEDLPRKRKNSVDDDSSKSQSGNNTKKHRTGKFGDSNGNQGEEDEEDDDDDEEEEEQDESDGDHLSDSNTASTEEIDSMVVENNNNDNDKNDSSNGENDNKHILQGIKSRRLSMAGRDIYSRSTRDPMDGDDIAEEEGEDDDDDDHMEDDEEREDSMADTSNNSTTPLKPIKNNKNNKAKTSSHQEKASPQLQQQQDQQIVDEHDKLPQDTDENDEKENTPTSTTITSTHDSNDTSRTINSNLVEESEKLTTGEEDRDNYQTHREALEALTHIEVEFARLRDKMYQEKMEELNEEAIMIANGTHPELVTLMTEIEEKKERRISTAEAWRKYQHANFKQQFEGFEYQANVHFISSKTAIRRDLLTTVNGKHWRLEDEQSKLNDPLQKPGKLIPDVHKLRLQKQIRREETLELQDIKDAIGFPRAPQAAGLTSQNIRDDLLLLGLGTSGSH
ncbi:Sds3-like-domain-containing protein [Halteromyces radiatus]|uniref:Sds3-like-domain-containing protein n=1 Tax=Halteromyces radiatus TaxID=101107 RepID=UPI0022207202|nr:Sds3-like-domain-containing protein [Halteromyces radiatus]KAI8097105.1 Sds3-like-domain-containing protein [Halteromyces radiatus]